MSEFVVHSIPGSPFGRTVLATLEEKGAPYRLAPVAPGTFKSPEHLARHPFGRVPVLEHDGFRLYETQAILRYLDRVLPTPALTPADPKSAARMDQVMNVNDWYLFQDVGNVIIFHRVIGPRLMGLKPDEAAIEAAMPKGRQVFSNWRAFSATNPISPARRCRWRISTSRRRLPSSPRRRNGPNSARRTGTLLHGWRAWKRGRA
jgi:glutathione S-transferase